MDEASDDAERQKVIAARLEELKKAREQEVQVNAALRTVLDEEAFGRLSNIKMSNAALYAQLASYILSLYQAGKLRGKVNEEQLKKLASLILAQKKEGKIIRISK